MKRVLLGLFIALVGVGFTAADVEARRLGGGLSQGMKRTAPPPRQAPDKPAQQAAPQQQATPAPATAGAAAAAAPARRSWMGPIAGLAAGLGIAALMSHLGLGEAFGNILTLMLLALAAVFLVRFLMRRFSPAAQPTAGARLAGAHGAGVDARPAPGGSAFMRAAEPVAASALQPAAAATPVDEPRAALPPGFDQAAFERGAKMIFIRMQAANDSGDVEDLRQFSTPEMFAAFRVDIQERAGRGQRTDVVQLEAQPLDWAVEDGRQIVSVRFHGLLREEEGAAAEPFDEVWHLARPEDGSRSWAIAGIQQQHALH